MRAALLLLLLPAVVIAVLAALLHSPASPKSTAASNMSTSQPASTSAAVTSISRYVQVAELAGKGRGMLATRDIPAGTLLWSERPLTSSPFPASSASQLTPQSAIDELAVELLNDKAGAYSLLCHHVELQHDSITPSTTAATAPSGLVELGVPSSLSAVMMRRSPVADWSDLQFSIAASQVQSNAFATSITKAEVEAVTRDKKQRSQQATTTTAAGEIQPTEETRDSDERGAVTAADSNSTSSNKSRKNAKKRAKRKEKPSSSSPSLSDGSPSMPRVLTLYVHISMLNHCCYPNAQVYWPAGDATDGLQSPRVYAISDVKAGDELCISYRADLLHYPTPLRQSIINSSWHFHCACSRCTQPHLYPHDDELLGLTQPLSDEQQTRMQHSFTALSSYAEQLSATSDGEVALHPRMVRQLFDFLALPLSNAHWRRHRLRSLFLPLLLAQSTVSYVDKRRVLDEQIKSDARILPPLHAGKLQYLLTFVQLVELEESGRGSEDVMKELKRLEPHADDIIRMYK